MSSRHNSKQAKRDFNFARNVPKPPDDPSASIAQLPSQFPIQEGQDYGQPLDFAQTVPETTRGLSSATLTPFVVLPIYTPKINPEQRSEREKRQDNNSTSTLGNGPVSPPPPPLLPTGVPGTSLSELQRLVERMRVYKLPTAELVFRVFGKSNLPYSTSEYADTLRDILPFVGLELAGYVFDKVHGGNGEWRKRHPRELEIARTEFLRRRESLVAQVESGERSHKLEWTDVEKVWASSSTSKRDLARNSTS